MPVQKHHFSSPDGGVGTRYRGLSGTKYAAFHQEPSDSGRPSGFDLHSDRVVPARHEGSSVLGEGFHEFTLAKALESYVANEH